MTDMVSVVTRIDENLAAINVNQISNQTVL